MRIIAIIENVQADAHEVLVEKWVETKSFDDSEPLKDVITWAEKYNDLRCINVKLVVDQSSIVKQDKNEMIWTICSNENEKSIYVRCDCGCAGIHLDKIYLEDEPVEYILSLSVNAFYEQQGRLNNFKRKIKMIWYILRHGTYRFAEICLSKESFKQLKELIKNYE